MEITRETTGELTATIKIEVTEQDYLVQTTKVLKDYQRKASIPGFRPGKVPFGHIRKMYGKAVLAEEINRILSESLIKYIQDEKLDVLGHPLADRERSTSLDAEEGSSFLFYFDVGLAPEIKVPLTEDIKVDRYTIRVDEGMVDRYIENIRKRYGKAAEETEPSASGNEGPKKEPAIEPAEMNAELFGRVYPGMEIATEEGFREKIARDIASNFTGESDRLFYQDTVDTLVREVQVALPETFMKKWLIDNNEGKYSPEQLESEYPQFLDSMRWQLIENRILKDHGIRVGDEDIRDHIKSFFKKQIPLDASDPETEARYDRMAGSIMENKEQVRKINDELYYSRLLELFRSKVGITEKEVSYEEFITIASTRRKANGYVPADHDHDHDHDPVHDHGDHEHEHGHDHTHR